MSDLSCYINVTESSGTTGITIKDLRLDLPDRKTTLVENFNLTLNKGERLMLMGQNGSGKSTLAKAILDLWDYGEGTITLPKGAKTMAVSQKVYFPNTPLQFIPW